MIPDRVEQLVQCSVEAEQAMVKVLNLLGRRFTPGTGTGESEALGELDIAWIRLHTELKRWEERP